MLVTVLGSCVAACIRDPQTRVGGMNHFMLPESFGDWGDVSDGMRYGNVAMERLINDIGPRLLAMVRNIEAALGGLMPHSKKDVSKKLKSGGKVARVAEGFR